MTELILLTVAGIAVLLLAVQSLITQRRISKLLSRLDSLEKESGVFPFDEWR